VTTPFFERPDAKPPQAKRELFKLRDLMLVAAYRYDSAHKLPRALRGQAVEHGHWIVTDRDGKYWVLPPNVFDFFFQSMGAFNWDFSEGREAEGS
jgi:hypothetical protein